MKKLILIVLSLLMIVGLTACSGEKDDAGNQESSQGIEQLYPGILDKGYFITYDYSHDNHSDLDYTEYITARIYNDEGNLGLYTCMLYNLVSDGIEISLHDSKPKSIYDYSEYYKDLSFSDSKINAKVHLGYMNEDDNQEDESYWSDAVLDLSKNDTDKIITCVITGKRDYDGELIPYTANVTMVGFDDIQDAYNKCKEVDTNNIYRD